MEQPFKTMLFGSLSISNGDIPSRIVRLDDHQILGVNRQF